jgi:hypothetical protein
MKYLPLALLALIAIGCKPKSEFDISPAQAQTRVMRGPGPLDMNHLPPGAVKHEKIFQKGDKMPDGTIADGDRKMVTIEMNGGPGGPKGGPGGKQEAQIALTGPAGS